MSARLRSWSSLHPLTVTDINAQRDDCCGDDPNWVRLCPYHRGFQGGIDQLLDQQEVKSDG